jgi:S-adenosylmethionine/arginine decarboxylase-like enzyme
MYICVYVYVCEGTSKVLTLLHIHIHIHTYTHIHVYIHIHTYTHIYIPVCDVAGAHSWVVECLQPPARLYCVHDRADVQEEVEEVGMGRVCVGYG